MVHLEAGGLDRCHRRGNMPFDRHNGDEQIDGECGDYESKPNPRPFPDWNGSPPGTACPLAVVGVRKHDLSIVSFSSTSLK